MRRLSQSCLFRSCLLALAALAALVVATLVPQAAAAGDGGRLVFRPPVDAPVADPFRSPDDPYSPGNRGVEYDTVPGDPVLAAADGTVVFAGPVAGALHVTVDHGGGVVSSYSYLERVSVRIHARVGQGQMVGLAGDRLHFGVRVNGSYVDPARFMGVKRVRVRLVPLRPYSYP